ncbi:MAG: hypothetical protein PHE93_00235 [Clostridia bacterium]|nr:hypothetical protein [Clostridia bacterium]
MAVVLNDLLGISTPSRARRGDERMEQFPSYDEFWASRSEMGAPKSDDFAYDCNYREDYSNDYQPRTNRNEYSDYHSRDGQNDFPQDFRAESGYAYGAQQNGFHTRENESEYYGSKRVSSSASTDNFREDVQAHTQRGEFNSCLYSVRDELSSVSDSQYQDALFDRLAFVSPLANAQQMRTPTRRIAAEPIARGAKKASRLTFKGKVILAVYIALAVLITTLIAINASGFNGTGLNAGAGNNVSYTETATEVETQANSTSAVVSNTAQDVKFDYVQTDYNYAVNSNWFDRLCDNIGKMFN